MRNQTSDLPNPHFTALRIVFRVVLYLNGLGKQPLFHITSVISDFLSFNLLSFCILLLEVRITMFRVILLHLICMFLNQS